MSAPRLYGIHWQNGDIEVGGTKAMAEFLGGLALVGDADVLLMVSDDDGTTWDEVDG